MKSLEFSRCALCSYVAVAMLAGCGNSTPAAAPTQAPCSASVRGAKQCSAIATQAASGRSALKNSKTFDYKGKRHAFTVRAR
jgi:hypothetical protein